MTDEMRSPDEQEYAELFASVDAPPTMRRWGAAGGRVGRPAAWSPRWSRLDLRGRYVPIAVAGVISLLVGSAGAAIGLHARLSGGAAAATPGTPSARSGAAMAYDPADHLTLLFGGQGVDGSNLGDTWAWDGSSWAQLHPATSPPARTRAQMAWDADRGRMVLFGGDAEGRLVPLPAIACTPQQQCPFSALPALSPLTDTWTWDGSTWRQAHPAHHPIYGFAQGMVDDPASHQVVLLGTGPSLLEAGDGSPAAVPNPRAGGCGASQCSVSCSSWSSSGPGGSASGGGACTGAPAFACPTPYPAGAGQCTSFTVSASGPAAAPSPPACPPPATAPNGATTGCSGPLAIGGAGQAGAAGGSQAPAPAPQLFPCAKVGTSAGGCPQSATAPTFGWNGSDWSTLTPLPFGSTHVARDPQSGRPLALTENWGVTCPASAAAGAVGNDAASLCLACPPDVECALAGSSRSPSVGAASSSGSSKLCPLVGCPGGTFTFSLEQSRFDGSWRSTTMAGPLSQAVNTGGGVLSGLSGDASDASVVAIISDKQSAQTWRFDGHQWSRVAAARTPYLLDASIAEDPQGLVLFGGQTFGSPRPSNATYTWDGHSWTLRGAAQPAGAATPTAIPPAVSAPAQATSTPEPPQQSTSSSSTTVTPAPATPAPTPTLTPTPIPG